VANIPPKPTVPLPALPVPEEPKVMAAGSNNNWPARKPLCAPASMAVARERI